MTHSGVFGAQTATRSPGSNLRNSACAVRTDASYSFAYLAISSSTNGQFASLYLSFTIVDNLPDGGSGCTFPIG